MGRFKPATRKQLKLRMAIDGPSGAGKTFSALRFAFALGQRIAVIDTENRSASKYKGESPDGIPWEFQVAELTNYAPSEYESAIKEAGRDGYEVLVIDSLSHAWIAEGGALDLKDKIEGNPFTAWRHITPMHNRMVEAILQSPCHILVTMRCKTEFILEPNEKGKLVPRKVGMAPLQRSGMEYEFDVYGSMDWSHILSISKSRCSAAQDAKAAKPGPEFMRPIIDWLEKGTPPPVMTPERVVQNSRIVDLMTDLGIDAQRMRVGLQNRYSVGTLAELDEANANDLEATLMAKREAKHTAAEAAEVNHETVLKGEA